MKTIKIIAATAFMLTIVACNKQPQYRALIVTGQNTTDWKASTPAVKQIFEESGLFRCDVATTPGKGEEMSSFRPVFKKYNLVVLNYSGDYWSEEVKKSFVDYVSEGGGILVYHSASSAFPEWKEYNEICGLGGWGGRSEKDGPFVYYRGSRMITDSTAGEAGWYGRQKDFEIKTRNREHPVTMDLPARWMHGSDLLFARLRGPARNLDVLATAFCDTTGGGTGRDEPVIMTVTYGKGRVFHTTLGFPADGKSPALQCAGFITILQRGAEWAASGKVTQPVPPDFPNASGVSLRTGSKPLTLEEDFAGLAKYEIGKSTKYYTGLQYHIRQAAGNPQKLLEIEKKMVEIIRDNNSTIDARKLILRELSWMGSGLSIPAIKELQNVPELKDEADFALERLGVNQ